VENTRGKPKLGPEAQTEEKAEGQYYIILQREDEGHFIVFLAAF